MNTMIHVVLMIHYGNPTKLDFNFRNMTVVNLNKERTQMEMAELAYNLAMARKQNKMYLCVYTPAIRMDICDALKQVDARIRNLAGSIMVD